ncbi:hypothetical protein BDR26DRAFT_863880 [Obelidium mucronatum]|nr:hypothetical protein BDR26DRAFT_863880 [Obelidium mucronatum]
MIISDMFVLFALDAFLVLLGKNAPDLLTITRDPIHLVSQGLILGMLLIGFCTTPILSQIANLQRNNHKQTSKNESSIIKLSFLFYATAAAIVLGLIRPWLQRVLPDGRDPFLWLVVFLFEKPAERIWLLIYWFFVVLIGVVLAVVGFAGNSSADIKGKRSLTYLNFKRKYFHALAVGMFLPGYLAEADTMRLSFSVALSALIFVEFIRVFSVWPAGKEVASFLRNFLDNKDRGIFILSHLYLLIGCALPVWINRIVSSTSTFPGLYGIIVLGIADSTASIIGYRYGKRRWPNSFKTVEGTVSFAVSMFGACIFLDWATVGSDLGWWRHLTVSLISGLLEAVSAQNDNLLLPLISISLSFLL